MVSLRSVMNKVAPKLAAINHFTRQIDKHDQTEKKVKFDLATVSFQLSRIFENSHCQVDYNTSEYRCHHKHHHYQNCHHHHHRHHKCPHAFEPIRIPLWKAHLDPNLDKTNIFLHIFRQLTCIQWAKLLFVLFCIIQATIHCFQLYSLYRKNFTHSSVTYRLPSEIEFPSLTLCLPVIIPFHEQNQKCVKSLEHDADAVETASDSPNSAECDNTLLISALFNQSLSEYGHQCRVRYKKKSTPTSGSGSGGSSSTGFKSSSCATISPPIETYFKNRRCYTYLSEITVFRSSIQDGQEGNSILDYKDVYISLLIQSNRVPIGASTSASSADSDQPLQPELFIHTADKIPIDSIRSPVKLELNHQYKIHYYYLKSYSAINQWYFFGCHNYSSRNAEEIEESRMSRNPLDFFISRSDCVDRCILREQVKIREAHNCPKQENCISHQIPIRRDLAQLNRDKICFTTPEDCPNEDEESLIQSVLDQCDKDCPDDCETVDVQHETVEDSVETEATDNTIQVTIQRKIAPDIEVKQFPLMDNKKLLADMGGLIAFWLAVIWLLFQAISLLEYAWDMVQLHYL